MSNETSDSHHSAHHPQDDDHSSSGHHTSHSIADDFAHLPHWSQDSGHNAEDHPFLGAYHPLSSEQETAGGPDDHAHGVRHEHSVSDTYIVDVDPAEDDYFGSQ